MIFVINNLKYDTDKMELISDECEYWYKGELLGTPMRYRGRDVRLWRSSKGNWLLTYKSVFAIITILIGALSVPVEWDATFFLFTLIVGGYLFFAKRNWIAL